MEPLADCLLSNESKPTFPAAAGSAATPSRARLSVSQIETLWARMAAVYGHRWTSSYGDDPGGMAGDTWAAGLSGLTGSQLARGLEACVASSDPWPPSLPDFRAACLGIPPLASVRLDTGKASPFTRLVWQHLDSYRYKQAPSDQADRLLREAYELAREHVMRGGALPDDPAGELSAEKPTPKPADPERAAAAIDEISSILTGKDAAAEQGVSP